MSGNLEAMEKLFSFLAGVGKGKFGEMKISTVVSVFFYL